MSVARKVQSIDRLVAGVDESEQSLRLLLTVRRGTIPHRPDLGGLLHDLVDAPVTVARANAALLVRQSAAGNPQLEIDAVAIQSTGPGEITLAVTWHPVGASVSRVTEVTVR